MTLSALDERMADMGLCRLELMPLERAPQRILETIYLDSQQATEQHARAVLREKSSGSPYEIVRGLAMRAEAVRLVDDTGSERSLYTIADLRREDEATKRAPACRPSGLRAIVRQLIG